MAAPVYLFTGFLDSGKTTLIKETLNDASFMDGVERTLLIQFEDGEEGFDEQFLKDHHVFLEKYDDESQLTIEKMNELDTIYHPSQVFIEWNGTKPISETILKGMPKFWPLIQILTTIDVTTFQLFSGALRNMLFEQLRYSDVVICNRCTPDTSASMLRGNIKAINKGAAIFYEGEYGAKVELKSGTLPFDKNAKIIDIQDEDYGLWYMDAIEHPDEYNQKTITLRGMYAQNIEGYKQTFILGRNAMVCCANDTSLCGITVTGVKIWEMKKGDWVEVTGQLQTIDLQNGAKTLVLYASNIKFYQAPVDPYVYFS